MKVVNYTGDSTIDGFVEVRGVLNPNNTITYQSHTKFNTEFEIEQFEEMVDYFQGMCRNLCV